LGGSASGSGEAAKTVASYAVEPVDPTAADQEALTNVRAAIPAIEAWNADHGTYKGMTEAALNGDYDRTIGDSVRLVGPLTKDVYCVESTVGSATWHKAGPRGLVEGGSCADTNAGGAAPPHRVPLTATRGPTSAPPCLRSRPGTSTTAGTPA
jgi:hypothetical protein